MITSAKKRGISLLLFLALLLTMLPSGFITYAAPDAVKSFQIISQVFEYGNDAVAVAIDAGAVVKNTSINKSNFSVKSLTTSMEITAAYANTSAAMTASHTGVDGNFIILELKHGYNNPGSSLLTFSMATWKNAKVPLSNFTVTQSAPFQYADSTSGDCTYTLNSANPEKIILVDEFAALESKYGDGVGANTLKYRLYNPGNFAAGEKVPLVLWLHGYGEGGSGNDAGYNGVVQILGNMGGTGWVEAQNKDASLKAYVAAPQSYNAWDWSLGVENCQDSRRIDKMLKDIIAANPNIDTSRIYVTGCSMGGGQTLMQLIYSKTYPDAVQFAAAFPICPAYNLTAADAAKIKDIPMTIFQSRDDPTVNAENTRTSVNFLLSAGAAKMQYTEYDNVMGKDGVTKYDGHWSWVRVLNNQDNVMNWLFNENRTYKAPASQLISPTISNATVNANHTVTLTWSAVTGATGYNIYERTGDGWITPITDTKLNSTNVTGTTFTTPIMANGNHNFLVTAYNSTDASIANSSKVKAVSVTGEAVIAAPTLSYTASSRQVAVNHTDINYANVQANKVAVYYTIDGSTPTVNSTKATISVMSWGTMTFVYTNIAATQACVMKVIVVVDGISSAAASINVPPAAPAAPTSGAYQTADLKALKLSSDAGAKIYYTTGNVDYVNGVANTTQINAIANPTEASTLYNNPINLLSLVAPNKATVIKAYAVYDANGTKLNSSVATFYYVEDPNLEKLSSTNIDKVVSQMTLEEKVYMLGGIGMSPAGALNNGVAGGTYEIKRLGIPSMLLSDGPAGVRMGKNATVWMSPTGLASSWNIDSMEKVATRTAAEAKHYAVDVMLAPALNIQRNPLGGRDFEYYSEDPIVSGEVASAYTRALQNNGVGVSLKHYAANNSESNRMSGEEIISERALREIYLRGFEMAMKENPWTVMGSYNKINSVTSCSNTWLLTDVLRGEWGFDGYTMTDWGATYNVQSVEAQLDLAEMNGNPTMILNWINDANITATEKENRIKLVERSVKNILKIMVKTPVYKGEYANLTQDILAQRSTNFATSDVYNASKSVNRETASEGMVLLKNNGALPLLSNTADVKKVALITSNVAYKESLNFSGFFMDSTTALKDLVIEGGGSAQVIWKTNYGVTLEDGMKNAGYDVVYNKVDADVVANAAAEAAAAAASANYGIFVLSRTSGEGADNVASTFDLSATEKTVFNAYADAFKALNKKFIVIINAGAAVNTTDFNAKADAILDVWLPGTEGGNAIADVLCGKVNPSGKLTQTFPKEYNDSSSIAMVSPGHEGKTWAINTTTPVYYDEGVYVGYRYFDTFGKEDRVSYPFGYGLSYTNFEFSDLTLSKTKFSTTNDSDTIEASIKVTNKGTVAGKEVVQLYLGASTFEAEKRPVKELKHYAKTSLLAPGASETVKFTINKRDLQYFDDANLENKLEIVNNVSTVKYGQGKGWTVEDGTKFTVTVGNTSDSVVLAETGKTAEFSYGSSVAGKVTLINQVFEYGQDNIAAVIDLGIGNSVQTSALSASNFDVAALNKYNTTTAFNGKRNITAVYANSSPSIVEGETKPTSGRYIIIELQHGFGVSGATTLRYTGSRNQVLTMDYTITLKADVGSLLAKDAENKAIEYKNSDQINLIVDEFERKEYKYGDGVGVGANTLKYVLYNPGNFKAGEKVPLVLWLHGAGEGGTGNDAGYNGITQILANAGGVGWVEAQKADPSLKAFVVAPQAYNLWDWGSTEASRTDVKRIDGMLKEIIASNPNIDTSRIYVSGCSMGGGQTFAQLIYSQSTADAVKFSAAIPICPAYNLTANDAARIKDVPMTIYQSKDDPTVQPQNVRNSVNLLIAAGTTKTNYTECLYVAGKTGTVYNGHWSWVRVLNNENNIINWLFSEPKPAAKVPSTFPTAPTILDVSDNGNQQANLTWNASAGVDGYNIYERTGTSSANYVYTKLNQDLIKGLTFTTPMISAGSHTFIAVAVFGTSESLYNTTKDVPKTVTIAATTAQYILSEISFSNGIPSVAVYNGTDASATATLIVCAYDDNDVLLGMDSMTITMDSMKTQKWDLTKSLEGKKFKAFLWKGISDPAPLAGALTR